ncbi:MAG: hypothetical protein UDB11_03210 [Peptococcaceae bacterium]|nr:hypothetical protein [Peptococcaceae bacterium]
MNVIDNAKDRESNEDKQKFIYRRYITKNGVKIYPKNAKVFKIPVK